MYAWSSTTGASAKQICTVAESVCTSKQLLCPILWNFHTVSAFKLICLLCTWFTLLGFVGVSHSRQSLSIFALLSWIDQITLFFLLFDDFLPQTTIPLSSYFARSWEQWRSDGRILHIYQNQLTDFSRHKVNGVLAFGWGVKKLLAFIPTGSNSWLSPAFLPQYIFPIVSYTLSEIN